MKFVAGGPVAADGVQIPILSGGQRWLVSWHPPPEPPDGTPHGAEGVCVTADGDIAPISVEDALSLGSQPFAAFIRRELAAALTT